MKSECETFEKFVRLKLTGQVVELDGYDDDSGTATIKFLGSNLTVRSDEISRLTAEEIMSQNELLSKPAQI